MLGESSFKMPTAVLFACKRNAVRSPMAAALASHYFGTRIFIDSVGVEQGEIDPFVTAVMAELGIDIEAHQPKTFAALDEEAFDLIITLAPEAHHHALDLTRIWSVDVEYWPTQDPTPVAEMGRPRETILEAYRAVRDALTERILVRLGQQPMANL